MLIKSRMRVNTPAGTLKTKYWSVEIRLDKEHYRLQQKDPSPGGILADRAANERPNKTTNCRRCGKLSSLCGIFLLGYHLIGYGQSQGEAPCGSHTLKYSANNSVDNMSSSIDSDRANPIKSLTVVSLFV